VCVFTRERWCVYGAAAPMTRWLLRTGGRCFRCPRLPCFSGQSRPRACVSVSWASVWWGLVCVWEGVLPVNSCTYGRPQASTHNTAWVMLAAHHLVGPKRATLDVQSLLAGGQHAGCSEPLTAQRVSNGSHAVDSSTGCRAKPVGAHRARRAHVQRPLCRGRSASGPAHSTHPQVCVQCWRGDKRIASTC
jgi:hypothetical protein